MKLFILLLISLNCNLLLVSGRPISSETLKKLYTQFKGFIKFILRMEEKKPIHEDVAFTLYTRYNRNAGIELTPADSYGLIQSPFSAQLRTIFIVHGYTDHKESDKIIAIRKTLLDEMMVNVIVVDWKRLAGLIYFTAASHVKAVGKYLAKFLRFLEIHGVKLSQVHLIGHSLGAQISGMAGALVDGQVGRVTGLDPAGPLFEFIFPKNTSECLDAKDALFVDVIHTAGDDFGIMRPVGHVDFYPNGGVTPQPGCTNIFRTISCSHIKSVEYFIESIKRATPFLAVRCENFVGKSLYNCNPREVVPMGYFTPVNTRGVYYLQTNPNPPYSMGGELYVNSKLVVND